MVMSRGLVLVLALCIGSPALASGGGDSGPWEIDPFGGNQTDQRAYYDGNAGVLMNASPWSRLFAAWRILHRQTVGYDIGKTLAVPCCDAVGLFSAGDIAKPWLEARAQVTPGDRQYLDTTRSVGDYMSIQNCFSDAFGTAAKTLNDRIAAHGKGDPWVKAWVDGQDIVFQACSKDADLPALAPGAPDWLVKDRAYQDAAVKLYKRDFPAAATAFDAIAKDTSSPWHEIARYLSVRAAVHQAIHAQGPETFAGAHASLTTASGAAEAGFSHADIAKLESALAFREDPDKRREQLAQQLTAASLTATAAVDFKDIRRLGQKPPNVPEFLDWLATYGRNTGYERNLEDNVWDSDEKALAHARERWTASKDPAWLLAVMQGTKPGDEGAKSLVDAAAHLPKDDPAFITAAYHRVRLTIEAAPAAQTRADLDAILARTDLSATSRNLFLAERAQVADDLTDFERFAPRTSVSCESKPDDPEACVRGLFADLEGGTDPAEALKIGTNAVAIIDKMDLDTRAELSERRHLPPEVQFNVAFSTWVRAALLLNDTVADRIAKLLADLKPDQKSDWDTFLNAKNKTDKRFAAWFILVKTRTASIDINEEGDWQNWLYIPADKPVPPVKANPQESALDQSVDLTCLGNCGPAGFALRVPDFVAKHAVAATDQRGHYLPLGRTFPRGTANDDPAGAQSVWEELLSYVQAHPNDSRSPEALYWLVRVSRFGNGHNQSSRRAFKLLHSFYADSKWAKDSKYYYD